MRRYVIRTARIIPTPVISVLGPALGNVFLITNPWLGALLWLGVFQDLRYAAFALIGIAVSEGITRAFRIPDPSSMSGLLKANALLAAMAVAWLTAPIHISVEIQIIMVVLVAAMATVFSAALARVLTGTDLPVLVLGYCGAAVILFVVFRDWTPIASAVTQWPAVPDDVVAWVGLFFRSLGSLLYLPEVGVGLVVAVTVAVWSRAAFAAGLIGWLAGVGTSMALAQVGVIYSWMPTSYNFFLAGLGLGAVFFLPGRGSLAIATVGGSAAAIFAVTLQYLFPTASLGFLPVASALAIWIGIKAMAQAEDQKMFRRNLRFDLSPEQAWWRVTYWLRRMGEQGPLLIVPIGGEVQISEGTDGGSDGSGELYHALDFRRPLHTTASQTEQPIWDAPVTAPAAGVVERVENGVADNPVGTQSFSSPRGNYVMLRLDQGGWALLAHLRQKSIAVRPGERVEIGGYLGKVGNSGRSSLPHLHLHVQDSPAAHGRTVPFRLANYLETLDSNRPLMHWNAVGLPSKDEVVAHALANGPASDILTSFAPGGRVWTAELEGQIPNARGRAHFATPERTTVFLNEAGEHVMRASDDSELKLNLDPDAWRIVETGPNASRLLQLLSLAIPSIPYAARPGMIWAEPAPLYPSGLRLGLAPYLANPFPVVRCRCVDIEEDGAGMIIETYIETPWRGLPSKLTCRVERLRGPTRIEAEFGGGRVIYSLLSFETGLKAETEAA